MSTNSTIENLTCGQELFVITKPCIQQSILFRKDFSPGKIERFLFLREHGTIAGERAIMVRDGNGNESAQFARIFLIEREEAIAKLKQLRAQMMMQLLEWISEAEQPIIL